MAHPYPPGADGGRMTGFHCIHLAFCLVISLTSALFVHSFALSWCVIILGNMHDSQFQWFCSGLNLINSIAQKIVQV